jgi:hypothetical protein
MLEVDPRFSVTGTDICHPKLNSVAFSFQGEMQKDMMRLSLMLFP